MGLVRRFVAEMVRSRDKSSAGKHVVARHVRKLPGVCSRSLRTRDAAELGGRK